MTMITGSLVAIVTPMHADGSLDIPGLRKLIDWHISEGTDGIVIAGTTGESATVSVEEHRELIQVAVEHTNKRIPVIAGSGGNSTQEAIALTAYAKEVGADASLQVVPYYNRPTQEGMYQHFKKIAESVDIPLILYNVPGRTASDMSNETIARLAQIPNIVGIKEASGNIGRDIELLAMVPEGFAIYSGDDLSAMALMLCGGKGNISVTANIAPRAMHELCVAAMAGDIAKAKAINQPLIPLHMKLFIEPNPVPVKWAMAEMGLIPTGIRLPLVTFSSQYHETLANSLRAVDLLK
ncbi:dapA: dihydrodipicolinate synthase [Solimicrobium silvestre]|uniref:4-hydroxy-tetrahydrodipicolinate synthase n=2 Tax=Solimicrobium silvestre TaxID=2099400 RepID=A0A2S9GSM0_9BURK|nr:dapA: dihydrodipicolinate synthase [Solimicrobium silvestre]